MLTVEFTIEPFVEGQPGPHVMSAVAAVEALGLHVEFGPFGSACAVEDDRVGEVAAAVFGAAFANGATHVTVFAEPAKRIGGGATTL
jgi:uncharacterized protein YqgV (UPF0045/DUF77 family)